MILFKIQFPYKGNIIEGSVHELESHPKQWHITVTDEKLPPECRSTFIVGYDYEKEQYTWGFPSFDHDHSFMHSLGISLRDYLWKHRWNSVTI